jgi:hypothetical protein
MADVRIYVSFDRENDQDLHDLLLEQSLRSSSGFEVATRSDSAMMTSRWDQTVRRRISAVDEVVVICGEHTDLSPRMSAELRIAQEEQKPYFLLWGRRDGMCTKPAGAKPADGMYSWTWEILRNQIVTTMRNAQPLEVPEDCKRA